MALHKLEPEIAQYVITTTNNKYLDTVDFAAGTDGPWLAVAFIQQKGVLFYSNDTHSEGWQGNPEEIIEKGEELIQQEINTYRRVGAPLEDIEYDKSNDPAFDLSEEDLQSGKLG